VEARTVARRVCLLGHRVGHEFVIGARDHRIRKRRIELPPRRRPPDPTVTSSQQFALVQHRLHAWAWSRALPSRQRGRAFPARAARKLLLVTLPDAVSQSQVYPFHFFAGALRDRWGYEVREIGLRRLQAAPDRAPRDADVVCLQAGTDQTSDRLRETVALLRRLHPGARLAFLDPCATTDLPFAAAIGAQVDVYVKPHVLRDRSAYLQSAPEPLPEGFLDKLVVGPGCMTAPDMLPRFSALDRAPAGGRRFDLHARLDGAAMQADARAAVRALAGVSVTPDGPIGRRAGLRELAASTACLSPFDQACRRDVEAVCAGALLVKPDMSHVETAPDIFVPGQTYLPIRRDFADLAQAVEVAVRDEALRRRLVDNAWAALHDFAHGSQFLDALEAALLPGAPQRAPARAKAPTPRAGSLPAPAAAVPKAAP
jgi:hypothetical protein